MDYKKLVESLKYYGTTYAVGDSLGREISGTDELMLNAAEAITDLLTENQALRNAANGFKNQVDAAESRAEKAERERDAALTALYPTPSGGPLPIEQLEKMTGLPVFLYIFDYENHNCWQIIEKIENGKIFFKGIGRLYVPISELGEKYNLYAHHAARINQNYTNADKIRSMTDEELAVFLDKCEGKGYQDSSITPINENGYHMDMLDWLKQPAKEE